MQTEPTSAQSSRQDLWYHMFNMEGCLPRTPRFETRCSEYLKLFRSTPILAIGEAGIKRASGTIGELHRAELRGDTVVVFQTDIHARCFESSPKDIAAVLVVHFYRIEVVQHGPEVEIYFHSHSKEQSDGSFVYVRTGGLEADKWKKGLSKAFKNRVVSLHDLEIIKCVGGRGRGYVFQVKPKAHPARACDSLGISLESVNIPTTVIHTNKLKGQTFALKVTSKSNVFSSLRAFRCAMSERLMLEAMGKHPHILPLSFAFQNENHLFIGTPFCAGGDMLSYHRKRAFLSVELLPASSRRCHSLILFRSLPKSVVRRVLAQVIAGLSTLHENGVMHCGLKLENILIDSSGRVKLGDFSLAKFVNTNEGIRSDPAISAENLVMRSRNKCGSNMDMSPEACKGHYSFCADVWSLGVSMYRLLSGKAPYFRCKKHEKVEGECPVSQTLYLPPKLNKDVRSLLIGLLQPRAERRPTLEEVRRHSFFHGVRWDDLEKGRGGPPAVTGVANARKDCGTEQGIAPSLDGSLQKRELTPMDVSGRMIGFEYGQRDCR